MTKDEKAQKVRHIKREINPHKARIISLMMDLESMGAHAEAKSLSSILGRLEAWQLK